jgi:hypothetical protein
LLVAVLVSAILTVIIPYTSYLVPGFYLFGTAPLDFIDWLVILPFSFSGFLILPEFFYGRKVWKWR